jgi:hypothetical protein
MIQSLGWSTTPVTSELRDLIGNLACGTDFATKTRAGRRHGDLHSSESDPLTLALNWSLLAVLNPNDESRHYVMVVRVLAFLVLIAASWTRTGAGDSTCGEHR